MHPKLFIRLLGFVLGILALVIPKHAVAQSVSGGFNGNIGAGYRESAASRAAFTAISGKDTNYWAIRADKTLVEWGVNLSNTNGVTTSDVFPTGSIDAVAIRSGGSHALVQKADGTLVGYGSNSFGERNIPSDLGSVLDFDCSNGYCIAVKQDGTVKNWGSFILTPTGLSGVAKVSANSGEVAALKTDGTVVCWGNNSGGRSSVPSDLGNDVTKVVVTPSNVIALKADGTVRVWGDNTYSQLTVPGTVTNIVDIAGALWGFSVVKSDGTVVYWGYTGYGVQNVPSGLSGVAKLASGSYSAVAIKSDRSIVGWPQTTSAPYSGPMNAGQGIIQAAAGNSYSYSLRADGTVYGWSVAQPNAYIKDVVRLVPALTFCYFVRADGSVTTLGSAGFSGAPSSFVGDLDFVAGSSHAAVINPDGTVYAWGTNTSGQTNVPSGLSGAVQLSAGANHTLALKSDGTVVAWGSDSVGQIDVPLGLANVIQVSAAGDHSAALRSDGTVVCWGQNSSQQSTVPSGLSNVVKIATTSSQTIAIKSDGSSTWWGSVNGQGSNPFSYLGVIAQASNMFTGFSALSPVSIDLQNATINASRTLTGVITLPIAPGAGGADVLLSTNTVNLSVPGVVHVAQGSHTATFTISASPVASDEIATVSARYNSATQYATITISNSPDHANALTVNGGPVVGGSTAVVTGTVSSVGNVTSDTVVSLTSSDTSYATVPATVTIPAGQSSATFTITTKTVVKAGKVWIAAKMNGEQVNAQLDVNPFPMSITFNPTSVSDGSTATGTISLGAVTSAAQLVTLTSADTTAATVPASVTVAAGASSATFTVTTKANTAATSVKITGSGTFLGSTTGTLGIVAHTITSLTFNPASVVGGTSSIGKVTLSQNVTVATTIALTNSDPSSATVQASVTVAAGASSAGFSVSTKANVASTTLHVTATLGASTATGDLQIVGLGLQSLTFDPSTAAAGAPVTATLSLTGASTTDTTVTLTNSNPTYATAPATVVIPAGSTTATFTVTTVLTASDQSADITATVGSSVITTTLPITGLKVKSLTLSPDTVKGGLPSTGTVKLTAFAPSDITVALTSTSPEVAKVPASVVIHAGSNQATFDITTFPQSAVSVTHIGASILSVAPTTTDLTVNPPVVISISTSASVYGMQRVPVTITLDGPAPSGTTVQLSSSNASFTAGPSVRFDAGSTTATVDGLTADVTAVTNLTLTCGGQTVPVSIRPNLVTVVKVSPTSFVGGSSTAVTGTVTLAGPTYQPVTVQLGTADIYGVTSVPFTLTIPVSGTGTFPIAHQVVGVYDAAIVTATRLGKTKGVAITVAPNPLVTLSLSSVNYAGGSNVAVTGTVTLTSNVARDTVIALTSDDPSSASVPASVVILAGTKRATFPVTHYDVNAAKTVTITASRAGSEISKSMLIQQNTIVNHTISATTVVGGGSTTLTGMIVLRKPVGRDTVINLSGTNANGVTFPATVTVLANQDTVTYQVTASTVTKAKTVYIFADKNGSSRKTGFSVTP